LIKINSSLDITGLQYLHNLNHLDIYGFTLKDISILKYFTNLKFIGLSHIPSITDYIPCDLPNLQELLILDSNTNPHIEKLLYLSKIQTFTKNRNIHKINKYPIVSWTLNKKINILIGNNGTGKTRTLNFIYDILKHKIEWLPLPDFILHINDSKNKITKGKIDVIEGYLRLQDFKNAIYATVTIDENTFPNVTFLKTFDTTFLTQEVAQKISDERVKTKLDYELYQHTAEFRRYDARLSKRLEKLFLESSPEVDLRVEREKLYATKTYFIDTVNRLFGKTGKTLEITPENDIYFSRISPYELSSGEKQMLIIMLSVLSQDNQPHVLLMDEPESSLHLDWQEELIEILRKLNPNCQLIIATHAPAIIQDGYWDYVTDIEDIIKPADETENV